jgi:hypothetical protein
MHESAQHRCRLAISFLERVGVELECRRGVGVTEATSDHDGVLPRSDELGRREMAEIVKACPDPATSR